MEDLATAEASIDEWSDEEDPSVGLTWQVRDRGSLEWAVGRLGAIEADRQAIETAKKDAIERIEKRASLLTEKAERGARFFRSAVAIYADAHRGELLGGGKKKSLDLLHGRIAWRVHGGKLIVEDKPALIAWLERQPAESGLYRIKVEPEMRAIQDAFKTDGVIPPGCSYAAVEDVITVEPVIPGALAKKEG